MKLKFKQIKNGFHLFITVCIATACVKEEFKPVDPVAERSEYRIAVVLPLSDTATTQNWQHCIDWAIQNFDKAQQGPVGVRLTAEWFDEDIADIAALARRLASRTDISAIIGPLYSANAFTFAVECAKTNMPMFTTATSEQLARANARSGFLWCLSETDITQSEVLLSIASKRDAIAVTLLAKDDVYGATFTDWLPFQAQEIGLTYLPNETYDDNTLEARLAECASCGADMVICAPSSSDDAIRMVRAAQPYMGKIDFIFSDNAFTPNVVSKLGRLAEGMEGSSMSSDPSSGFDVLYHAMFDTSPTLGSSQYYDAVMIVGLAAINDKQTDGQRSFRESVKAIVSGHDGIGGDWMPDGIAANIAAVKNGRFPVIRGASGLLQFDKSAYTSVVTTTFCYWQVYDSRFITLDYLSAQPSHRVGDMLTDWNWRATHGQTFEDVQRSYPPRRKTWALIVAASTGWENYRHQADAFAVYQMLRRNGMDDDHIVMIAEDDIATHSNNIAQGEVRTSPDGANLYSYNAIDYKTSDLCFADLDSILRNHSSARLNHTIAATADDNVLVFWIGHGTGKGFVWADNSIIAPWQVADMLRELSYDKRFRKMLWLVETCYSGLIGEACRGIDRLLFFTAANAKETSKATNYDTNNHAWLSNAFSLGLVNSLTTNSNISFHDLYYYLYSNTIGSHVTVYNEKKFDNLNISQLREFVTP